MAALRESPVDAPAAHELLAEYFQARTAGFADQNVAYTTTFPLPAAFVPPAGVFLMVHDDEGRAVGCGGIRHIADGGHGTRYEVKHLYLRPETRGRGWGRMLLDGLEERARKLGARELVLDTHHSLEAAGALYARSGFVAIEPYNDNPNASRWYGKALGEGAQTG
ncbi:GNAT family N-acetyltransferase [Microbacterium sp. Root180]|uniref:GNAT family N-acetyltransferase n=1 Tax=Microbacterium sp. Root180 TaxID=1736483 RepID=UPI0006F4EFAF|nr:GNAT family N-acetyltransferase [Microbacterium sp. Root180]KRB36026.1 PadR family transcriptional regulator [Microbacterium sp. Root180]